MRAVCVVCVFFEEKKLRRCLIDVGRERQQFGGFRQERGGRKKKGGVF